jgi:hypothetical protein
MVILNYTGTTHQKNVTVLCVLSPFVYGMFIAKRKKKPAIASNNGITEISFPYKGKVIPVIGCEGP